MPDWFKKEIGFKFVDGDGDFCVYLGKGKLQTNEHLGRVELEDQEGMLVSFKFTFHKHLYACLWMGEWCTFPLELDSVWLKDGHPATEDDEKEAVVRASTRWGEVEQ